MKKSIKKKIGIGLGIVIILLAAAALGFSYFFGSQVAQGLFYQNEGNDTKSNSIKQLAEWGYDLEAFKNTYTGEQFTLEASDGNHVPAEFFSTDNNRNKDTVILVHGAGGDHVFNYPLAEMYLKNNWNVVTFDMRGHGDNESPLVTFGYLERIDIEAIVDYVRETAKDKQLVVHGQSMGGAATGMYAATDHAKDNIDAVIMDSPVYDMKTMFLGVWHQMEDTDGIPDDYIIACGNLYMNIKYGFDFGDVDIAEEQKYNDIKTLVIVSEQDEVCLPEGVAGLYENVASSEKELMELDCAHIKGIYEKPEVYEAGVMDFLAE